MKLFRNLTELHCDKNKAFLVGTLILRNLLYPTTTANKIAVILK
jgi:hypothetical protein